MPIGGGGLSAGVAAYVKRSRPGTRVVGVEPEGAPGMTASLEAGRVVELAYFMVHSCEEIAEITGLPMGTVKSSLHRARKELAEHLERLGWSTTIH